MGMHGKSVSQLGISPCKDYISKHDMTYLTSAIEPGSIQQEGLPVQWTLRCGFRLTRGASISPRA